MFVLTSEYTNLYGLCQNYKTEDDFIKNFYDKISITVTDIQSTSSSGTVTVIIPDLHAIYLAHHTEFWENPTNEQIQEVLAQNLHEFMIEKSFSTDLYKDASKWKMMSTDQIGNLVADVVDNYLTAVLADIQFTDITIDVEGLSR